MKENKHKKTLDIKRANEEALFTNNLLRLFEKYPDGFAIDAKDTLENFMERELYEDKSS